VNEINIGELINRRAVSGNFKGSFREVDRRNLGAGPRKIYGVRADPATHFEDTFAGPLGEYSEPRDVGLDKVFSSLHFIEILALADRS
jgi:hypothetical protein